MGQDWTGFEQYVEDLMKKDHIPGVAVAVYQNDHIIYQKGFGYRNLDKQAPVTPETIFGIASVTKSFTAAAIIELEKSGKLSVNDSVVKYLPELKIPGFTQMEQIKIHHLLSHTSGLPPLERKEEINQLKDHLTYLSHLDSALLGEPGEYFSYSNDAFLLLGLIIERVTGWLYRRYITHHFLNQLEMHRSTMSLEELMKFDNVTVPYTYDKEKEQFKVEEWPALGNYEVGGGIRSTVLDLIKYGKFYLHHPIFTKMMTPNYKVYRNTWYGYGLMMTPYKGMTLVEHSGGQPGVSSHFGFAPEKDLIVAVLTNGTGAPAGDIWLAAINTVFGWPTEEKATKEPHHNMNVEAENRFIGIYESREGARLEILKKEGQLVASFDKETYDLRASDERTLVIKEWDFPIPFFFDENEQPWAAFWGMRMLRRKVH